MIRRIREWLTRLVEGVISSEDETKIAAWQDDRRREQADRTFTPPTIGHLEPSSADLDAIRADGVTDDDQPVEHTPRSLRRVDPGDDTKPAENHDFIGFPARPDGGTPYWAITVLADWLTIEHRCGIDLLRARLIRMRTEAA